VEIDTDDRTPPPSREYRMECTRTIRRTIRTVRTAVLVTATALLAGLLATTPAAGPTTVHTALAGRVDAANRGW
jgi:hypothetical protein